MYKFNKIVQTKGLYIREELKNILQFDFKVFWLALCINKKLEL